MLCHVLPSNRALKSVLVMAGRLKRENPQINEDIVLIRALRDANVPKFLSDDLVLFKVSSYAVCSVCSRLRIPQRNSLRYRLQLSVIS